jgi:hypothetical protein
VDGYVFEVLVRVDWDVLAVDAVVVIDWDAVVAVLEVDVEVPVLVDLLLAR